jgi:hypothetical protein
MPYQFITLLERRVLYQTVEGHYSIAEFARACIEASQFLDTTENQGIILGNYEKVKTVPNNLFEVRRLSSPMFTHPKHALTIVFGTHTRADSSIVNFLVNTSAMLFQQPIKAFPTEAEAMNYVTKQFPDLSTSLPAALKKYYDSLS